MPPNTVSVARPGPWGNPFIVGKHGTTERCVELFQRLCYGALTISIDHECVDAQFAFLKHAEKHIGYLRGKNLACWCRMGNPCHADVLLRIVNANPFFDKHESGKSENCRIKTGEFAPNRSPDCSDL